MRKTLVIHGDIKDLKINELAAYFRCRAFHNMDKDGQPAFRDLKNCTPALIFTAYAEKASGLTKELNGYGFPARTLNLRSAVNQMTLATEMIHVKRPRSPK
jgi:hypothetical protein